MRVWYWGLSLAVLAVLAAGLATSSPQPVAVTLQDVPPHPREFPNGLPKDTGFVPIAVWLQQPDSAAAFSDIGINTFIGLWHPPTEAGLAQIEKHGLHLIVQQTPEAIALRHKQVIRGWLHVDEPDNAQPIGGGYGDCIVPENVVRMYGEMRAVDPTRPVYLNFGQAVANPRWFGRGPRCSAIVPKDYYTPASRGADIVAFDIYPVVETRQAHVIGKLDLVGRGVANLKAWSPPGQPVWAAIETTHINNPSRRPLPHEVRSEVWMALIHGASGITYFVHEWKPSFREDGVFRYPDTVEEIRRINTQIRSLAPVLNSATVPMGVRVDAPVEIATMVKRYGTDTYVFAVNMERKTTRARLVLSNPAAGNALVLGEERTLNLNSGGIEDEFGAYAVHLYKISGE
jgi:hypothetical protein